MRTRMVAMAFGACLSGLSRAAARDVGLGQGNVLGAGSAVARGGKRRAFLEQIAIGRDAQTRMVMKATPTAALVVAELLFEFQPILPRVGAFDAPAPFGAVEEMLERGIGVAIGEPDLGRLGFTVGPFGEHGQLRPR